LAASAIEDAADECRFLGFDVSEELDRKGL
jgi:hypothetical protein